MTRPVRLQLRRTAGFDLQAASQPINGLPAISVARPSEWGNPFRVGLDGTATACVELFRHDIEVKLAAKHMGALLRASLKKLRGRNLACWCAPGAPCHADVLLDLANGPVCDEASPCPS